MAWSRFVPGLARRLARPAIADLRSVSRLAVLRADGIGDIVLTTGFLRELRRHLPRTRIAFICQSQWASWMRTCPWVDEIIPVRTTSGAWYTGPLRAWHLLSFIRRAAAFNPQAVLQPGTAYWYVPSRSLSWFTGAPVRVCWEDPSAGVDTGGRLHTTTLAFPNAWHEADKCFRLLDALGMPGEGPRLDTWCTPEDSARGAATAQNARQGRDRLVALGLGATEESRRWPRERFLEVIQSIGNERDVSFLALGGNDVARTRAWLASRSPRVVAPRDLSLGAAWAAIANSDLYLGNDTGLMHMAAAARVPVVAVIGLSENAPEGTRGGPSHTGPYDTVARVVRPAAGTGGSRGPNAALVSTDAVRLAALELLS